MQQIREIHRFLNKIQQEEGRSEKAMQLDLDAIITMEVIDAQVYDDALKQRVGNYLYSAILSLVCSALLPMT